MSIATRLKRLEGDDGDRCLVCGAGGDGPTAFRILTDEPASPFYRPTILSEPDRCPACGRSERTFTMDIRIAYGEDADTEDDFA